MTINGSSFYELKTLVRLTGKFTLADGTPVDPTTVILYVKPPTGPQVVYTYPTDAEIERIGVGVYGFDLLTSLEGTYLYKWQGTGIAEVTSPDIKVVVRPTSFTLS